MYIYKFTVALLAFLTSRLHKAAEAEYAAFDRTVVEIAKLEVRADDHVANAKKVDALASKLNDLVQ